MGDVSVMPAAKVDLREIRAEASAQMRIIVSGSTVDEYTEAISAGAVFPPIVVFFDGEIYWLADGFHRLAANRKLGHETITADIREGGLRDAIQFSLGANETHGLRLTRADKRRAVETALADREWAELSDRDIAKMCFVSHTLVAQVRKGGTLAIEKPRVVRTSGNLATTAAVPVATIAEPTGNIATGDDDDLVTAVQPMLDKASDAAIVDLFCVLSAALKKRGIK
jgi:hypothetical protein